MTQLIDQTTLGSLATEAADAMFSLHLEPVQETDAECIAQGDHHVVMLRLHGVPAVLLILSCGKQAGADIASAIFEVEREQANTDMIDDSLRELANIFAGQVKSMVVPDHEIGLPRVQRDLTILRSHVWHGVSLRIGDGENRIDFALAA